MIILFLNTAIIFLVGFLIIKLLKIQLPAWGILGKGSIFFGIGVGAITLQLFFYSIISIPFSQLFIALPWFILLIIMLKNLLKLKNITFMNKKVWSIRNKKPSELFIGILLLLTITLVFFQSIFFPLTAWDGWAMWSFKAKVFFLEKSVSSQFLTNPYYLYSSPDHPLLFPLIQTWLNLGLVNFDDQFVKILSFLFYSGILIIFYKLLRSKTTKIFSLLFTFLFATIPIFRESGYLQWGADLPLAFYFLGTIIFLEQWFKDRKLSNLILSALFLGFGGWTKNEGIMFAIIVILLGMISIFSRQDERKYFKLYILAMLIPFLINIPWQLFRILNKIPIPYLRFVNIFNGEFFHRLERAVIFLFDQVMDFSDWSLGLLLLIITPFVYWKVIKKNKQPYISFFYLIILCQLAGYFIIIALVQEDIDWQLQTAFVNLLIQIFPSAFLLLGLLIAEEFSFQNRLNHKKIIK